MSNNTAMIGRYFNLLKDIHSKDGEVYSMAKLFKDNKCDYRAMKILKEERIVIAEHVGKNKSSYKWGRDIVPNVKMAMRLYELLGNNRTKEGKFCANDKEVGKRYLDLLNYLHKESPLKVISTYVKEHSCSSATGTVLMKLGIMNRSPEGYMWYTDQYPSRNMASILREAVNHYQKDRSVGRLKGFYYPSVREVRKGDEIKGTNQEQEEGLLERVKDLHKEYEEGLIRVENLTKELDKEKSTMTSDLFAIKEIVIVTGKPSSCS